MLDFLTVVAEKCFGLWMCIWVWLSWQHMVLEMLIGPGATTKGAVLLWEVLICLWTDFKEVWVFFVFFIFTSVSISARHFELLNLMWRFGYKVLCGVTSDYWIKSPGIRSKRIEQADIGLVLILIFDIQCWWSPGSEKHKTVLLALSFPLGSIKCSKYQTAWLSACH